MRAIAGLLTLFLVCVAGGAATSAQTCEYAGQTFSAGATIRECPNLRVVRNANGGRGEITSRRLACKPGNAEEAFKKFHATYCPRLPVNHVEIQKAVADETEKFFSTATRSQALTAVQAICRRFADLSDRCQAMIDGFSAPGN